jgi:hypothetical protein
MVNLHRNGCLCANCQMTREHWQGMGMELPVVIQKQVAEAGRNRTEILSDADLRATWAPTMAALAEKAEARSLRASGR